MKKIILIAITILAIVLFVSCNRTDSGVEENEIITDVKND